MIHCLTFHLTRCLRTLRARLQSSHSVAARAKGPGQGKPDVAAHFHIQQDFIENMWGGSCRARHAKRGGVARLCLAPCRARSARRGSEAATGRNARQWRRGAAFEMGHNVRQGLRPVGYQPTTVQEKAKGRGALYLPAVAVILIPDPRARPARS